MRYEQIRERKASDFKRLTGILPETFIQMVIILSTDNKMGRPPKLDVEDQLLMTLMYWREYRTQFHIAGSYGVSEATVSRTIKKVENRLMASGKFTLPGKKKLLESETKIEVILVDVSEQPIERPKKTKNVL